jgi:hypothetical protein
METKKDLQTILIQFTYAGIMGVLTQNNYVLWDGKGFPIKLAGNELRKIIVAELAKRGLQLKEERRMYA